MVVMIVYLNRTPHLRLYIHLARLLVFLPPPSGTLLFSPQLHLEPLNLQLPRQVLWGHPKNAEIVPFASSANFIFSASRTLAARAAALLRLLLRLLLRNEKIQSLMGWP